jgi:UDP-N-acetylmuramoylalanine--D-glutamate ligase
VGLPLQAMLAALRQFSGLPHRCQWVAEFDGVNWYNDSKATNVGASLALIQGMPDPLVLIMGGQAKGQDFTPLVPLIKDKAHSVVLMGEDAPLLQRVLAPVTNVSHADTMSQAVQQAARVARPGDSVVLSPACASFDMFDNFEQRGEAYMQQVRSLSS